MAQKIFVLIIGAAIVVYLCVGIYRLFFKKGYNRLCSSCPQAAGCGKSGVLRRECDCGDIKTGTMSEMKQWNGRNAREWFEASGWGKFSPQPDETTDMVQLAEQAHANPAEWEAALKFLKNTDFSGVEPGKYPLSGGGAYANVQEYLTRDEGLFEAHRKFIDIQYIVSGSEYIDVAPIESITEVKDSYNNENDIMFFNVGGFKRRVADAGTYLVLFPSDGHRPCMKIEKSAPVKKIVVKIPFAEFDKE